MPTPPRRPPSWPPWFGSLPEPPPEPTPPPRGTTRLHTPPARARRIHPAVTILVALAFLVVLAAAVRATLFATAEDSTSVATGTLLLTLEDAGAGLSVPIAGLAPGDTVDRFVDLTNTGTLGAGDLTVTVASTGSAALIDDGATTRAVTLAIDACTTEWDTEASTCAGTSTSLLPATMLGELRDTPGPLGLSFEADEIAHLRLRIGLPDQDETSTNGVLPSPTIQGASADVTLTFRVEQRDAAASDS